MPTHVSLKVKSRPITNYLEVERQYPRTTPENIQGTNASIVACWAAITTHVSTVTPSRLVEFVEANKLLGITPFTNCSCELWQISKQRNYRRTRKRLGLLPERDTASIYNSSTRDFLRGFAGVFRYMQQMCITYCLLKNALKFDYIAVHDWDETVGFDMNKHSSLRAAIMATRKEHGKHFHSFNLKDTIFDHHCSPDASPLNFSRFVISEAYVSMRPSIHMGKTIHVSRSCLYAFHHMCLTPRSNESLCREGASNDILSKKRKSIE